jgi:hypothetical protein
MVMSLASCPTCGYALSTIGNKCRHCTSSFSPATSAKPFDAKILGQIIAAMVVLSVLLYLIFFR